LSGVILRGLGYSGTYITRGYGGSRIIAEILSLQSYIARTFNMTSEITDTQSLTSEISQQMEIQSIIEL